jgi:hypothetical protein
LRRLVIALVVLSALGLGVDVGTKSWAQGQIEKRARTEVPDETSVSADINAFPFLPPLFLGGRVSVVEGHFKNVKAGVLSFASVDIELRGVRINRSKLVNDRKVELTDISEGTVSIEIAVAELARVLRVPVTASNGELRLTIAGTNALAKVSVRDNALFFDVAGVTRTINIPKTRFVPCASRATVLAGRIRVTCTITEIPPALLGAANRSLG